MYVPRQALSVAVTFRNGPWFRSGSSARIRCGVSVLILNNDLSRFVCRTILANHNLDWKVRLLHQHAFECLRYMRLVVIRDQWNADHRLRVHQQAR